jgi:hypothetical protein
VVEFCNALYQPLIDRFVAGAVVENAELRQVWRYSSQLRQVTLDAPCHEQFFRMVRAVNAALPAERRLRELLGGPPLGRARMTTMHHALEAAGDRDRHLARTEVDDHRREPGGTAILLKSSFDRTSVRLAASSLTMPWRLACCCATSPASGTACRTPRPTTLRGPCGGRLRTP